MIGTPIELFAFGLEFRVVVGGKIRRGGLSYKSAAIKVDRVLFSVGAHFTWRSSISECIANDSRQQPNAAQIGVPVGGARCRFGASRLDLIGRGGRFLLGRSMRPK